MFNIRDYQIPRHNGLGSSGYPETRDILPFVTTFQPSLAGALLVRQCLECALPSELVNPIVSLGYSPWVVKRKVENVDYYADDAVNGSMAGLYLATEPIPYPDPSTGIHRVVPKRIIFQTRAADRGVGLGPNETTADIDSWFEASILQPLPGNLKGDDLNEALKESQDGEDGFQEHFNSVSVAAEDLKEKGWEFVKTDDGEVSWRVCNNIKEKKKIRAYKVEWSSGGYTEAEKRRGLEKGKGEEFLEKLKPGSIFVLWARAEVSNLRYFCLFNESTSDCLVGTRLYQFCKSSGNRDRIRGAVNVVQICRTCDSIEFPFSSGAPTIEQATMGTFQLSGHFYLFLIGVKIFGFHGRKY